MEFNIIRHVDRQQDSERCVRFEITSADWAVLTTAEQIAAELQRMHDGTMDVIVNGVEFTVHYDERQATGDNGRPVRGDMVGDFEVVHDGRVINRVHVSPHGTSGYGNPRAKSYAAETAAAAITRHSRQLSA
jgi:hypothetical protein